MLARVEFDNGSTITISKNSESSLPSGEKLTLQRLLNSVITAAGLDDTLEVVWK